MEYRIAVCDDVETDAQYIADQVKKWAAMRQAQAAVEIFSSGESFLFRYAEQKDYDILLLDIEMASMNGVALAKEIRRDNESVQIIFITGYSDYIAEGYEVAALHYLMKPVKEEKLFQILDRAVMKLQKNERVLILSCGGETVRVPVHEIRYLEVQHNYVTVHAKEAYTVKKTLGEFQRELDERFYRMGRSYIVNLSCIERITKSDVFLTGGEMLPLPRGQYDSLNRAFIAYE